MSVLSLRPRLLVTFLLILVAASPCLAIDVKILPVVVTNETPVTVYYEVSVCGTYRPIVTRDGSRIEVSFPGYAYGGCEPTVPTPRPPPTRISISLGAFQPGTYELSAIGLTGNHREEIDRRLLIVHDVTTLPLVPAAAPVTGVQPIIMTTGFEDYGQLSFFEPEDGFVLAQQDDYVRAFVPEHKSDGAGTMDVEYENDFCDRMVARNGFTYVDDPCSDPRMWEYYLVPVYPQGVFGAFGSLWHATLDLPYSMGLWYPGHVKLAWPPCSWNMQARSSPSFHLPVLNSFPNGFLLGVMRGDMRNVHATLRISNTRGGSIPVEVPVVHENDWFRGPTVIPELPSATGRRRLLRLWALDDEIARFRVNGIDVVPARPPEPSGDLRVASIDLSDFATGADVSIETVPPIGARYWAMMTITDNLTQHVSVFVPQAK